MRVMVKDDKELKIYAHFIIKNMWEYYVTELPGTNGIGEALVMGYEIELGSYFKEEVAPYVICYTENLRKEEVMPAEGWYWKED